MNTLANIVSNSITRGEYISGILWIKRGIRQNDNNHSVLRDKIKLLERERKIIEAQDGPFAGKRRELIESKLDTLGKLTSENRNNFSAIAKLAADFVLWYDTLPVDRHEQAQILGISHIAYEHFVKEQGRYVGNPPSLYKAIMFHAETAMEDRDFIGDKSRRDYPLFNALSWNQVDVMHSTPELREKSLDIMEEVFGPIPWYQVEVAPDGTETIKRLPPRLKVVKEDGELSTIH